MMLSDSKRYDFERDTLSIFDMQLLVLMARYKHLTGRVRQVSEHTCQDQQTICLLVRFHPVDCSVYNEVVTTVSDEHYTKTCCQLPPQFLVIVLDFMKQLLL